MLVRGQRKRPMAVHPTVGVGFTPGGVLIDAAKPFGNNTLILLFFVSDWAFGLVHHLVGTDHIVLTQAQETAEK